MTVLPATTRLFYITVTGGRHRFCDCLPVGDPGASNICLDPEFPHHAIHNHIKMQFAHPADDRLPGIFVHMHLEGGVFFRQPVQCIRHFVLICRGFGFNRDRNDRLRELDGFQDDGMVLVTQGIARKAFLEPQYRTNITGTDFRNILPPVSIHPQQATNSFTPAAAGVISRNAGNNFTGIHAEISQPSHIGIADNLKNQSA